VHLPTAQGIGHRDAATEGYRVDIHVAKAQISEVVLVRQAWQQHQPSFGRSCQGLRLRQQGSTAIAASTAVGIDLRLAYPVTITTTTIIIIIIIIIVTIFTTSITSESPLYPHSCHCLLSHGGPEPDQPVPHPPAMVLRVRLEQHHRPRVLQQQTRPYSVEHRMHLHQALQARKHAVTGAVPVAVALALAPGCAPGAGGQMVQAVG
jgi:hypothetical protein